MQPSSSAVSRTKTALVAVLALAAHIGGNVQAQYANGEEVPLRPEPPAAGKIVQQPAENTATAANNKKAAEEKLPGAGDDLDAYAAAQIVAQAQETHAAKEAAAATQNTETAAATSSPAAADETGAPSAAAGQGGETPAPAVTSEGETATDEHSDDNVALLPVEKLSPPPEPPVQTETVVVEQAIYRCPKGKSYIYVDADKRKGYSRCTLFRAEKTEEVPVGSSPSTAAPTGGNPNNCSGTLQYKGSTYLFMEHQPCPIPDSVFQRLTPAATSR